MLDGLLGRGFASKCKSLIKLTKSRIDVIRRKRKATMKFLKKDIADLLANGLDINAYGRADGLLVELTVSSCYDYIEETCDFVLKHLSVIQKQRECPEECREAVSSLMFAAARFSDLPELRDIRQLFHERYGNSLEYFANKEFVEKLSSKPAEMESKVQLMQDIALEFSIRWDSMAFQHRMSNPSVPAPQGQKKNYGSPPRVHANNSRSVHLEDCAPKKDRHKFAHKEGYELPPKYDYSPRHSKDGHASKRAEIDLHIKREIPENGHTSLNGTKETFPRNHGGAISFEGGRENTIEKHAPWIQKEDTNTRKDRFASSSHRNIQENPDERSKLQYGRDNAVPIRNGQDNEADRLRPYYNNAIPPPYVKPNIKRKDDKYSANPGSTFADVGSDGVIKVSSARDRAYTGSKLERVQLGDHSDHERHAGLVRINGHDYKQDHHEDGVAGDPLRKSSARDRAYAGNKSERVQLGDNSDHERQAGLMRMNGHDYGKDHHDDVTGDRDSLRKLKSIRRRHSRSRSNHDDADDSEEPAVPTRKSRSKRRDDPRRGLQVLVNDGFDDEEDEEERVIDRLLMHYSKKPTLELEKLRRKPKSRRSHHKSSDAGESPWNNSKSRDKPRDETEMTHAPLRSSSLPHEQSAPSEPTKVFARAASFQPDRSSPAYVHPKLPDYDDLAARFASLKGR